jgi:hypothetical protein
VSKGNWMRAFAVAASGVLIALTLGSCGGDSKSNAGTYSGEKAKVATVVDELGKAARDGDGRRICNQLFDSNLRISVTRASKHSCAQEVVDSVFDDKADYDIQSLGVSGSTAHVRVKDQKGRRSLLLLLRESGSWRIARIS